MKTNRATPERIWTCKVCGEYFTNPGKAIDHVNAQHGDSDQKPDSTPPEGD